MTKRLIFLGLIAVGLWAQCGTLVLNPLTGTMDCTGTAGASSGDVAGPAKADDGHLAVFDGTDGKKVKDGGAVPVVPAALPPNGAAGGALAGTYPDPTLAYNAVNPQTGTSYALLTGDRGKLVTLTNGSAIAVSIAACGSTGFPDGWQTTVFNSGVGSATITPTTSTIEGAATAVLTTGQAIQITCNAANVYRGVRLGKVAAATVADSTTGNAGGTAAGLTAQYVDWNAASGGASIANKPSLGTASAATLGTGAGQVPVTGEYQPSDADLAAIAALSCTENQIIKRNGAGAWACAADATAGAPTFDGIGSGTNKSAAMVIDSGASLAATGSGTIAATSVPATGVPFTQTGTGAVATTQDEINKRTPSIKDFGAVGDTRIVTDGAMSSSTNPTFLSSATASFVAGDAGKAVSVAGAGTAGAVLNGTIKSVSSGTVAVLSASAATTVSGATVSLGTDDTAAVTAALAAHLHVIAPVGKYKLTSTITMRSGATLEGEGGSAWVPRTQFVAAFGTPAFSVPTDVGTVEFSKFSVTCSSTASSTGVQLGPLTALEWAAHITLQDVGAEYCNDNIVVGNAWGVTFNHVQLDHALRYGLYLHPPAGDGGYTTSIVVDQMSGFEHNTVSGIFADGWNQDITILNSYIQNSGTTDLSFTGTADKLLIMDSFFENTAGKPAITIVNSYAPKITLAYNKFNSAGVSLGTNAITEIGNYRMRDTLRPIIAPLLDTSTMSVLGANLVATGDFSADTGWTVGDGWVIGSGVATATAVTGQAHSLSYYSASFLTDGSLYKITYTVTVTGGAFEITTNNGGESGELRVVSGTYTDYLTFGEPVLYLQGRASFSGTVDNVTVQLVTPKSIVGTIASGATAMGETEIGENACATVVTVTATGVLATDVISFTPNASIKAVTGYAPAGTLSIVAYPTAGNVNFDVCNKDQTNHVTPGAVTLNWRVSR
jgi:hypothetical protein